LNKPGIHICSTSTDKLLSMSATEDDVVVSSGPDAQIVPRADAAAQIGYAIDRVEQASHTWRVINGSLRRAGIGTDLLTGETWRGSSGSEIILKRRSAKSSAATYWGMRQVLPKSFLLTPND
jgi:hypothetical protein